MVDEFAHHNLVDAAKISGLSTVRFCHCDPQSLSDRMKSDMRDGQRPLLMTDGVFATTGRVAPLAEYADVLKAYDGRMFVDESHSFLGVVGRNGRGAAEYCGVEHLARIGATLSKALCAQGALVGCSTNEALRLKKIPPMRGACAGSPRPRSLRLKLLKYASAHPELANKLRVSADYPCSRLRDIGLEVIESPAPIVSFSAGNAADMQNLQRRALARRVRVSLDLSWRGAGGRHSVCRILRPLSGGCRCAHFSSELVHRVDCMAFVGL